MLGTFARSELAGLSERLLVDFGAILSVPDPQLEGLIMGKEAIEESDGCEAGTDLAEILQLIQRFHGIIPIAGL